ncbi:Metacaspase-7 [Cladobotryum mycophilum]|uniref:Metacaspase-7 n=1 Tax=Cladobotryum mycophilum TaxID=491253 RepID=A0ABR0SIZ5_9HYPO
MVKNNRWALLVGIDQYSSGTKSLKGCVNDVQETRALLQSHIGIPPQNITALLAPQGSEESSDPAAWPTKANFIQAITRIRQCAQPGDLVYIHYSGHGDRVPTSSAGLKKTVKYDEVLCTLEEDVRDFEFGELLDSLVDKGLILCVVLDCCHAGGASRFSPEIRIRCRRIANDFEDPACAGNESAVNRGLRNAVPAETWFYKPRGYNLIAACQPFETASEYCDIDGKYYGALTFHLLQTLKSLQSSTEAITYRQLQDVLEAKCKRATKQQPMHLGDDSRIPFATRATTEKMVMSANVTEITKTEITLNKGYAHSIMVGDQFRVFPLSRTFLGLPTPDAAAVAEVTVKSVAKLQCKTSVPEDGLVGVESGCLAEISKRAGAFIVNVQFPDSTEGTDYTGIFERMQDYVRSHTGGYMPITLVLNNNNLKPMLTLVYRDGVIEFQDKIRITMPFIPLIQTDTDTIIHSQQVVYLLHHLCHHQLAISTISPKTTRPPRYEFEIIEDEVEEGDTESLAAWMIRFKNTHGRVLYLSIFNFTPAYGIHQLFPGQNASSAAVEPMTEIEPLVIDMKVPPALKSLAKPGFVMRDVIKVFVTTEQANFCHYLLPDLNLDQLGTVDVTKGHRRTAKLVSQTSESWSTEEKEITTVIKNA